MKFPYALLLLGFVVIGLSACAPLPVRPGTALQRAAQVRRAQVLDKIQSWSLSGRIGISNGHQGGSGGFTWVNHPGGFRFVMRAPITGRSFSLDVVRGKMACLLGLHPQPVCGPDAEALLNDTLGWRVPIAELRAWVMGLAAVGSPAKLGFTPNGRLASLHQDGWQVGYSDWDANTQAVPMPRRIVASKLPFSIRVYVEQWHLDRATHSSVKSGG